LSQLEDGAGRFPQVAGLKYSFDKSVAPNEGRLKTVEVMEGGAWKPIDPNKDYLVATNNYVRQGGDGYKIFAEKAKNAYDYGPGLEQVVADYLAAHRPYAPKLEGRITEIAAAAEETPAQPEATAPETTAMPDLPAGAADIANTPPAIPMEATPAAPAEAAAPATPATEEGSSVEASHVIVAGDTYWDLAVKAYGDGAQWKVIAGANKAYTPHRLPIGGTLTMPAK
jgi:5'-nucleotidase